MCVKVGRGREWRRHFSEVCDNSNQCYTNAICSDGKCRPLVSVNGLCREFKDGRWINKGICADGLSCKKEGTKGVCRGLVAEAAEPAADDAGVAAPQTGGICEMERERMVIGGVHHFCKDVGDGILEWRIALKMDCVSDDECVPNAICDPQKGNKCYGVGGLACGRNNDLCATGYICDGGQCAQEPAAEAAEPAAEQVDGVEAGSGDVNSDNSVDIQDAILIERHLVAIGLLNADQIKIGDVDGCKEFGPGLGVTDALWIKRLSLDIIQELPCR